MSLKTHPNLDAPDDFYELVVDAHRNLTPEQSRILNAKLILLLANHIGDRTILTAAVEIAKAGMTPKAAGPDLRISA